MDVVMSERMLKFVATPQAMPAKRPAAERRRAFDEIYANYAREKAAEQAARCSQCGVPFCQVHCPLHNNIPDWLKLTAEGRIDEAYELSSATNNFPEICRRLCPHDRPRGRPADLRHPELQAREGDRSAAREAPARVEGDVPSRM